MNELRIAIYIDYDNFINRASNYLNCVPSKIDIWDQFNNSLLGYIKKVDSDERKIDHRGTYLCVGLSDPLTIPELAKQELSIVNAFQKLNQNKGFIVKYGNRTAPYRDNETGQYKLGKEKGVDAEIICQMFMGAHLDNYDVAVLLSDDNDYLPVITRVQDYFSKKVIQVGFLPNTKIRSEAYSHIKLEKEFNQIFSK